MIPFGTRSLRGGGPWWAPLSVRPWIPWLLPVGLFAALSSLRLTVAALRWTLPVEPTLAGLLCLTVASALYTGPLFHWPGRIPVPVLWLCLGQAAFLTHYVAVFNLGVLGEFLGVLLGAVNAPLLGWLLCGCPWWEEEGGDGRLRMAVYRLYAVWLPVCLVPQIALLAAVAVGHETPRLPP